MALMWPLALGALLNAPPFPRGASRSHRHATLLAVDDLATRFSELRGHLSTAQQQQLDLLQKDTEMLASEKLAAEKLATIAEKRATMAEQLATTAEQLAKMRGKELQQLTGTLVPQLCVYKCVLENRHLLERAAEKYQKLYASERCRTTSAQVQQLINQQCINDNKLSEKAKALCTRLYYAGYSSAWNVKSIEQDMRNAQAYNLMSEAFHSPRIIDGETRRCAVIAVICIIIALDYDAVYAHLGSNAPNRLLILDERYRHIMTWRPGVGLYLSKAGARIRWNWRRRLSRGTALDGLYVSKAELQVELEKKTVFQLRQQCKDQGLSVSGSEHELVQRLLAATEAEDDLQTWVESRLTEAEHDLEAPAPTEAAPAAAAASPGRLRAAAAAAWQGLGRWIP